jgi:hypothetical protein
MPFQIVTATKYKAKARVGLEGPAGSGKTWTALLLAQELGGKVVLIDTERGSSAKYAKQFQFDLVPFEPPYEPKRYVEAIKMCEEAGYGVIIIDSLSHAWAGEGGALEMVDSKKLKYQSNSYYAWREVTPDHNKLVDAMLSAPAHVIACMRTKVEYAEEKLNGKTTYRKVGTQAIQREGMDYEFDIVFDLDYEHHGIVTKTRMAELADKVFSPVTSDVGKLIRSWVDEGEAPPPPPKPAEPKTQKDLLDYSGLTGKDVGAALKAAGITSFDPGKWEEMVAAIDAYKENGKELIPQG